MGHRLCGPELDGTLKEEIDEDGNIDSEFDNFGGNFNGNEFRIDGKIDQRNGPNGTDDFTFDIELRTTDTEGNSDTWRLDAELNIDQNGKLNGEMNMRNNSGGMDCFFNGVDALQMIQDENSSVMDENCNEVNSDVPPV